MKAAPGHKPADQSVTILDVGHGSCAVVRSAESVAVVDCGPGSSLLQFVEDEGIRRIECVLVSHADRDHIGGLVAVLSSGAVSVGCVRLNPDSAQRSETWNDLVCELDIAAKAGTQFLTSLTPADPGVLLVGKIRLEVVGPSSALVAKGPGSSDRHGRRILTNSISAVVKAVFEGKPEVLLTGDIDSVGLADLKDQGALIASSVLVYPHHGGSAPGASAGDFASALCRLVGPRLVVFSVGREGPSITPRPDVVAAVRESLHDVRIACTQLSRHCSGVLPKRAAGFASPTFASGRELGSCCAGSIVIDLALNSSVAPSAAEHEDFIRRSVPTPLCMKLLRK